MTLAASLPPWAIALGFAGLVLFAIAVYVARGGRPLPRRQLALLAALRAASLALVFLLLLDPVRLEPLPPGGSAVAVLVDASLSMDRDALGEPRFTRESTLFVTLVLLYVGR